MLPLPILSYRTTSPTESEVERVMDEAGCTVKSAATTLASMKRPKRLRRSRVFPHERDEHDAPADLGEALVPVALGRLEALARVAAGAPALCVDTIPRVPFEYPMSTL